MRTPAIVSQNNYGITNFTKFSDQKVFEPVIFENTVVKTISNQQPQTLDEIGLFALIEKKVNSFSVRTKMKCVMHFSKEEPFVMAYSAIQIFRILEEALSNCYTHANTSRVMLQFEYKSGSLIMKIIDNGNGFNLEDVKQKKVFGLLWMKERAKLISGKIEILSEIGKGTNVILKVPIVENSFSLE
jgi:two-component system sensor histidine kinase DegS